MPRDLFDDPNVLGSGTSVSSIADVPGLPTALDNKQDDTPNSKGNSRTASYSHSIGKSGGGSFYSGGIAAFADWRNQYPAKLSKMFGVPMDNRGVGGAQLTAVGFAAPNFGTILQQVVSSTQTGPAFVPRPGPSLYNFHFGANDQGFALANLSAMQHAYRACIARLLSNANIEDSDSYVTAAGGAAGTNRVSSDRNSGQSMRVLANGNTLSISGGPLAATFPGGEVFIRFIVESGDIASANIAIDGGAPVTQDLSHVSPQSTSGVAKINNRYDIVFANATGGNFTLSFGGQQTGAITWSSNANTLRDNIQTALAGLSSIGTSGSLPSLTSTLAAPANAAVLTQSDSTTQFNVRIDTPKIGAAGVNAVLTANPAGLTGASPTITINKQAGPVVYRIALAPGAHSIAITAAVTAGSVKWDGIDIITTGSVPPTVLLPSLHRFIDSAQDLWFRGFATDAVVTAWNTGLKSVADEFSGAYPRVIWVDFDSIVNKSVVMLGTGAGGALGDGIHPLEPATRAMAKALYRATPILTDDESAALGNEQVDWYDLTLVAPWVSKSAAGFFTNQYKPQFRKDSDGWVHLRGLVSSPSTAPSANTLITNLPPGFRPISALQKIAAADTGPCVVTVNPGAVGNPGQVRNTDGGIYQTTGGTSGGWTDLSGIAPFYAEE